MMTEEQLRLRINKGEDLITEFKSDQQSLPDRELIAAIVALANTEGGMLLLGVEDSGVVTGLHPNHQNTSALPAMVANKTNPALGVRVENLTLDNQLIACVHVPKSQQLVSTSEGLLQRRRMMLDGTPQAIPFYPHEFLQRQSAMGLIDPSAVLIKEVSFEQLDPLQRLRIRQAIRQYHGEQSLLSLTDEELEGALGLSREEQGKRYPTLAGLLLLGTTELLRLHVPAYEVAFQVLQGTDVKVNEFFRKPLLETFEQIELLFNARVEEDEIDVGLFRVPVPNYDRRAFREAFVNALVHRDFSRLGAVHVKLDQDGLSISSPGGFVDGVTLENLLVVDPRSRNPLLADIIKRIGLAERTGRGIDRIYEGMLRYGRPAPDFTQSNAYTVSVKMQNTAADLAFLKMIVEQDDALGNMPIDSLIILSGLRAERRLTMADLTECVQKSESNVRSSIQKLVEAGLIDAHGTGRGRSYTLSAKVYQQIGKKAAYVRQAGFDAIQQEQMVLSFIKKHHRIKRADAAELCKISPYQASRLLKKLTTEEKITTKGQGKGTYYENN